MKKTIRTICLFLAVMIAIGTVSVGAYAVPGAGNENEEIVARSYTFVLTPNGSEVRVTSSLYDFDDDGAAECNARYDAVSPNDSRLYGATYRFNCHSYAWYSQDTTSNRYWMENPSLYYRDGSYYEVTTPAIGDIICYIDNGGTPNNTADDSNLHSGIIVSILTGSSSQNLAGIYIVESKWGSAGLYRHNGYECPYTMHYQNVHPTTPKADYVIFYRRSGHTHSFTTYNDNGNLEYHECICSCGMIIHAPHTWVEYRSYALGQGNLYYIPQYRCSKCDAFTLNPV